MIEKLAATIAATTAVHTALLYGLGLDRDEALREIPQVLLSDPTEEFGRIGRIVDIAVAVAAGSAQRTRDPQETTQARAKRVNREVAEALSHQLRGWGFLGAAASATPDERPKPGDDTFEQWPRNLDPSLARILERIQQYRDGHVKPSAEAATRAVEDPLPDEMVDLPGEHPVVQKIQTERRRLEYADAVFGALHASLTSDEAHLTGLDLPVPTHDFLVALCRRMLLSAIDGLDSVHFWRLLGSGDTPKPDDDADDPDDDGDDPDDDDDGN